MIEERYIGSILLKEYCRELKLDYYMAVRYLLSNKYLYRILRGIFYKPSIEERKLNKIGVNYLEAISYALKIKGVTNWYLGLESALKMNNLTHEFFVVDYILNDKLFRPKPFTILGNKVKFIKIKKSLVNFGINEKGVIRYSDHEKTILDMIYLSKYSGLSEKGIRNRIYDILNGCSKEKLKRYAANYNKAVIKFVEGLA